MQSVTGHKSSNIGQIFQMFNTFIKHKAHIDISIYYCFNYKTKYVYCKIHKKHFENT